MSTEEMVMNYLKKIEKEDNRIAVKPYGDDEIVSHKFGKKIAGVYRNYDPSLDISKSKKSSFDVYISEGTTYSIIIGTRLSDTEPRLKDSINYLHTKEPVAQTAPYIEIDENTYEILCIDNGWKHSCYNAIKNLNERNKILENNYEKFKNIIVNFHW